MGDDLLRHVLQRAGKLVHHLPHEGHGVPPLVDGGEAGPPVRVEEVRMLGPVAGAVVVRLPTGDDVEPLDGGQELHPLVLHLQRGRLGAEAPLHLAFVVQERGRIGARARVIGPPRVRHLLGRLVERHPRGGLVEIMLVALGGILGVGRASAGIAVLAGLEVHEGNDPFPGMIAVLGGHHIGGEDVQLGGERRAQAGYLQRAHLFPVHANLRLGPPGGIHPLPGVPHGQGGVVDAPVHAAVLVGILGLVHRPDAGLRRVLERQVVALALLVALARVSPALAGVVAVAASQGVAQPREVRRAEFDPVEVIGAQVVALRQRAERGLDAIVPVPDRVARIIGLVDLADLRGVRVVGGEEPGLAVLGETEDRRVDVRVEQVADDAQAIGQRDEIPHLARGDEALGTGAAPRVTAVAGPVGDGGHGALGPRFFLRVPPLGGIDGGEGIAAHPALVHIERARARLPEVGLIEQAQAERSRGELAQLRIHVLVIGEDDRVRGLRHVGEGGGHHRLGREEHHPVEHPVGGNHEASDELVGVQRAQHRLEALDELLEDVHELVDHLEDLPQVRHQVFEREAGHGPERPTGISRARVDGPHEPVDVGDESLGEVDERQQRLPHHGRDVVGDLGAVGIGVEVERPRLHGRHGVGRRVGGVLQADALVHGVADVHGGDDRDGHHQHHQGGHDEGLSLLALKALTKNPGEHALEAPVRVEVKDPLAVKVGLHPQGVSGRQRQEVPLAHHVGDQRDAAIGQSPEHPHLGRVHAVVAALVLDAPRHALEGLDVRVGVEHVALGQRGPVDGARQGHPRVGGIPGGEDDPVGERHPHLVPVAQADRQPRGLAVDRLRVVRLGQVEELAEVVLQRGDFRVAGGPIEVQLLPVVPLAQLPDAVDGGEVGRVDGVHPDHPEEVGAIEGRGGPHPRSAPRQAAQGLIVNLVHAPGGGQRRQRVRAAHRRQQGDDGRIVHPLVVAVPDAARARGLVGGVLRHQLRVLDHRELDDAQRHEDHERHDQRRLHGGLPRLPTRHP
ncbi:hypothetical protein STIAU_7514 [Stigmatella aurantiaca DW4/3-1]|uniref:Uncharacterized protein n=1 Tax=Stigmatella aurantiaca (strain DW4/3-1) TaxID=378806 RepID=Q08YM9_STIAD|nr:hypothetical protein STIAU_7514 [Stigmatella aurantiaca DW4/3-1]